MKTEIAFSSLSVEEKSLLGPTKEIEPSYIYKKNDNQPQHQVSLNPIHFIC